MPFEPYHSLEEWLESPYTGTRTVLTIGNFDGVHLGHQKILRSVVERARQSGHTACVVTFSPHPLVVLRPGAAPQLLETPDQRMRHFESLGLDAALVLHFDAALAALSPEDFVRRILCDALHASAVLVGENFRFGRGQSGNVATLRQLGRALGFAVETIPPVVVRGEVVSSSAIRRAIAEGRVCYAARLLGRPFALEGEIRSGTGTGHKLLFPTLNLATSQEILPAGGVYATETVIDEKVYRSATNVGMRPTFDGTHLTVESHLFDFSRQLSYGSMEVRFWRRLRDERKFPDLASLRQQIQRDLARSRRFFARLDAARKISRPR
jgi:riboflavin kinase / FMN adenylyltransferase